ncbi:MULTISPECIES: bifunctional transcriptional activator/DNA repair enzyme AdaA [unclassified Enterococcus]|uniref:bifunctional transcriptional activator/DNA repair enzyme AdaA n=1 Tax=unclassified Enterococcus TaxID=2608891 RepID=UPI00201B3B85|nr:MULTISPECIES: bifunctional transcriptional activator/DNA repair enzyme AdaA [unclassified Enterococcus]
MITDSEWQALKTNDAAYDNLFRYAVKTTKIFCRPSCPSRIPKRENVEIYYDLNEPEKRGFRPCKRCQPTGKIVNDELWVEEIEAILRQNYQMNLSLKELAFLAHGSESYLRHVFKKITGQTPQQRLQAIRMAHARRELLNTRKTITVIAKDIGLPNVSYFIKKFKAYYGQTPKRFRQQNE